MAGFVVSLDSFTGCPLLKQKEELGKNAPKKLYLTYRDELGAHRAILLREGVCAGGLESNEVTFNQGFFMNSRMTSHSPGKDFPLKGNDMKEPPAISLHIPTLSHLTL